MTLQALPPTQHTSACHQVTLAQIQRILTLMAMVCPMDGKSLTADGLGRVSQVATIGPSIQTALTMQIGMQIKTVCQICVNINGPW